MSASPTRPQACLLSLPRELRFLIYRFYFELEGGYVFDREDPYNGTLANAGGHAIDLSLMYACRSIAAETKDLPLQLNTVTFSTAYHQDWSPLAGRFEYLSILYCQIEEDLAKNLYPFITPEISIDIAHRFPSFVGILESFRRSIGSLDAPHRFEYTHRFAEAVITSLSDVSGRGITGAIIPTRRPIIRPFQLYHHRIHYSPDQLHSTFQQAATYTLSLLRQKEPAKFQEFVNAAPWRFKPSEFDSLRLDPWAIPLSAEPARIGHLLEDEEVWEAIQKWNYPIDEDALRRFYQPRPHRFRPSETRRYLTNNVCFRQSFRFSAAAVAIRFLDRLSPSQRLNLRRIVLQEDHVSVGQPECHAIGLIPFCRENPRLRIERHVGLWRNILHTIQRASFLELPDVIDDITKGERRCYIDHKRLAPALGSWFGEALAAVDAGMPAGSFTLVLDGNPAINLSSEIFQNTIQPNITVEKAFGRCFNTGPDSVNEYGQLAGIKIGSWAGNHLLRGMDHLNNQASVIQCNFNPGMPWDLDKMVEERRQWPAEGEE
ncbi:hypothetical protein N0V84_012153 [Fusarium piperis]|uniref:Uncharacterized protein n=1 Tax=Fusarium piperis TaxID=1435070 RepID=A0A9W8TAS7_9HYPO|nr:hypothetical protein N0V84_012153 [Fusarium piperis]